MRYDLGAMVLELESLQTQIQRILKSKAFRTSEVQRNLLAYLAERSLSGNADSLKEYTVGLDVFAKPSSYDPRQESTVRMHVGRLRQKLAEYYRSEGADDPIVVDLPKGGFKVTFEPRPPDRVAEIVTVESPPRTWRTYTWQIAVLGVALVLAVGFAAYFAARLWRVERTPPAAAATWTPELQQLWAPILESNRPLMICLSTPSSGVTGIGTANGAFVLGQFLGERKKDVQLTPSDQLSVPEIAMGNVVFLGTSAPANRQIKTVPTMEEQLVLEANGVRNLTARAGEPAFLADKLPADPQDSAETHALISYFPGLNGNGEILYFSGNQIPAIVGAVQAFTDPKFARTLVAKLKLPNGELPRYYQVVLRVRSMDDMPIDWTYVVHREIAASKPVSH
jgi:hypothetical protein